MRQPPAFFESVRRRAAERWDQLEGDPELAGPWRQLFMQVQNPRHVVSELLQNADDAGATEASVRIEDDRFIFEHNGSDFTQDQFGSLCRFGFSNKRALHTIGFRGIGFKSTFSLGNPVELYTPTLSVAFHRDRFTEPQWLTTDVETAGLTRVCVSLHDTYRNEDVARNLDEWLKSPVSLLFFRSVRLLRVSDEVLHWVSMRPGPVDNSEWVALEGRHLEEILLLRSPAEAFPDQALAELREERLLRDEEAGDFPPCSVELAVGAGGSLFAVLPVGVETALPFACNAPFVPDPARLKIKEPGTSPTNRWLLQRAGELAGRAMLHWLGDRAAPVAERARAYDLVPDVDPSDASLAGTCGRLVAEAFDHELDGHSILLTQAGELVPAKGAVILPRTVSEVWPTESISTYLDDAERPAMCANLSSDSATKLRRKRLADEITKVDLLRRLQTKSPPKPSDWLRLLRLWEYLAPEVTGYPRRADPLAVRIVPAQGDIQLIAATEVVRLGRARLLRSEEDWAFFAAYPRVLDVGWVAYLAEGRETADSSATPSEKAIAAANAVMKAMALDAATPIDTVVSRASARLTGSGKATLTDHVRLAQITAQLGASVPRTFAYCTQAGTWTPVETGVVWDQDFVLSSLLPEPWKDTHLLHGDYAGKLVSCTRDEWHGWATSSRSGLLMLPRIESLTTPYGSRWEFDRALQKLGYSGKCSFHYSSHRTYTYQLYYVDDFDFERALRDHVSGGDEVVFWREIARLLLEGPESAWRGKERVKGRQTSTGGGSTAAVTMDLFPAAWVRRLARLPILPDTRGVYRKPSELLRRTPATETLIDVEPFVAARLDTESTRALLDVLGVGIAPTGPHALLDRLRALSGLQDPPVVEVDKWYRRIDQLADACSTADLEEVRGAFLSERLILADDGSWMTSSSVFVSSGGDDVPAAATVRRAVADLALWRKIGVADRPTADLALAWLSSLPSGVVLAADDARRVTALLGRYPFRVWEECAHWLNVMGSWVAVESLTYGHSAYPAGRVAHLFPWVKERTAELGPVPTEVVGAPPFSRLQPLIGRIEHRIGSGADSAGEPSAKEWLSTVAALLARIELDAGEATEAVRVTAIRLAGTRWRTTPVLSVTPYLDGTPAGLPTEVDVLWDESNLYVRPLGSGRLARRVPEEIGRAFGQPDIQAALAYCYERRGDDIRAYFDENFRLVDAVQDGSPRADEAHHAGRSATQPVADGVDVQLTSSSGAYGELPIEGGQPGAEPEEEPEEPDLDHEISARLRPRGPRRPSLIERFSMARGFREIAPGFYEHPDGRTLGRLDGAASWWEIASASGEVLRCFRPIDHCLEHAPLELDHEIWTLLQANPETYALILSSQAGEPVEFTGSRLNILIEAGALTLFPATYRLVIRGTT